MNTSLNRLVGAVLVVVLSPWGLHAQSPSLDTLIISPSNPNPSTDVLANVGGIVNISGFPIILTESRRINNDIRLDVLIDELPVLAARANGAMVRYRELRYVARGNVQRHRSLVLGLSRRAYLVLSPTLDISRQLWRAVATGVEWPVDGNLYRGPRANRRAIGSMRRDRAERVTSGAMYGSLLPMKNARRFTGGAMPKY
jgi:hypothetical protein